MRRFVIILSLLMAGTPAFAFKDAKVTEKLSSFKREIPTFKTSSEKLDALEKFRDFLADHLSQMPKPKTKAQKALFADLNEFQAAVFSIRMDKIDQQNCRENRETLASLRIPDPTQEDGKMPATPALQEALSILLLLCR